MKTASLKPYVKRLMLIWALAAPLSAAAQMTEQITEPIPLLPASTPVPSKPQPEVPKTAPKEVIAPPPTSSSVISVTKVVGEVGDQFITSREVKINSAVGQVLNPPPPPKNSERSEEVYKIPQGTERAFPGDVSRVLDEWAVFFEARSLGSTAVNKSEIARVAGQVQERWASNTSWKDLEVGTEELKALIERKLAASEFQKLKSDPALSPVSDDEALTYYKKNRLRFGSLPFSNFSENIKAYLVKTQVERRLSEWHEVLRRKYKTRNFISG